MFRTLKAALLAASLVATAAYALGGPAAADTATATKPLAATTTLDKAGAATKHVTRHHVRHHHHVRYVKHHRHTRYVRHFKHPAHIKHVADHGAMKHEAPKPAPKS